MSSLQSQLPEYSDTLDYIRQIERVETIANKFEILGSHFQSDVFLGVAVVVA